ncbi:MAG: phospholipid carrier-dependent glycosyltransferase, partial [Anaerolineae bacterium]|nr:phospholipid carrier-dependent glycosyltransferase [Phycisphaerae bacterium]
MYRDAVEDGNGSRTRSAPELASDPRTLIVSGHMPRRAYSSRNSQFRRHVMLILIAAAIVYLVGNDRVPLWDRDEPRYAQTSRQMLQSGDWVVPRFLSDIRTAKPIFIYWCQASAMKFFGDTAFAARFPSAFAMLLTLSFLALVLPRRIGRKRTALTILMLASSGLSIAAAKMSLTDSVLLLWITIAQACLYAIIYQRAGWMTWIVLGVAIGIAGLTKGPVVLGVMGMTVLVLIVLWWNDRRLRRRRSSDSTPPICDAASGGFSSIIKFSVALVIVVAICAPWLILIHQRAPEFLPRIIGHDVVRRATSGLEGHKGPPGYYLLTIWATYFPWSLFLLAAIVYAWRHRRNPLTRFALAAVVGPWVMFEIFQTKLVHYMLPIFPPLALLTARAIAKEASRLRRQQKQKLPRPPGDKLFLGVLAGWCVMVGLMTLVPLAFTMLKLPTDLALIFSAICVALIGAEMARATFVSWRAYRPFFAAGAMAIGTLAIVGVIYGFWMPNVTALHTSQRVAAALRAEGATHPGQVIMIDYKEPSLAFYQGGTIR